MAGHPGLPNGATNVPLEGLDTVRCGNERHRRTASAPWFQPVVAETAAQS